MSNGKVTAGAMADLRFETTGVVAHIYVKNGDPVRKGQMCIRDRHCIIMPGRDKLWSKRSRCKLCRRLRSRW